MARRFPNIDFSSIKPNEGSDGAKEDQKEVGQGAGMTTKGVVEELVVANVAIKGEVASKIREANRRI